MINRTYAKLYCGEDISLIENYDKASKDLLETWHLHHRKEDDGYSKQELIDLGLYYHRPASELKFLTKKEHKSLHCKMRTGEKNPNYGRTGEKSPLYGKRLSDETRRKLSEAKKGQTTWMKGKHHTEESRIKMSISHNGKTGGKCHNSKPVNQIDKQTGQVIKIWPCAMEVERVLGINHGSISMCCSGKRKSCGGYIWRYA